MDSVIKILFVEDVHKNGKAIWRELKKNKISFKKLLVDTRSGFLEGLQSFKPDVIISDYSLPQFDGKTALLLRNEHARLIPFILVTGSINEEVAVEFLEAGADDYIAKENLSCLGPAVIKSIRKFRLIKEGKTTKKDSGKSELCLQKALSMVHAGNWELDLSSKLVWFSEEALRIYGFEKTGHEIPLELVQKIALPEFRAVLDEAFKRPLKHNEQFEIDFNIKRANDGDIRSIYLKAEPVPGLNGEQGKIIGVIQDITERKQAESEIQRRQNEFQSYFDSGSIGLSVTAPDKSWIAVNQKLCQIFGYTKEELIGKSWIELTHPDDLQANLDLFDQALEGKIENYNLDKRFIRKDGSTCHVTLSAVCVRNEDGALHHLLASYLDTTERKIAENSLRQSEERFRLLIEHSHDAIALISSDGTVIYYSPSIERILGYSPGEAIGRKLLDFLHQEEGESLEQNWYKFVLQKEAVDVSEVSFIHKDGSLRRLEGVRINLLHEPAVQAIVVNFHDITEQKRANKALHESRQMLEAIIDTIPVRVFWKDKNLNYLGCNTLFAQDAGFGKPEDIIGKDDYAMGWREQAELYRADDLLVIGSGDSKLDYEERQTTPSGDNIWLLSSKVPLRAASGEVMALLGTYIDITGRKKAEEALFNSEIRYRRLFESAKDGILILDAETGKIIDVNPYLTDLMGYSKEEIIEKVIWEIGCLKDIVENRDKFTELQVKKYVQYDDLPFERADGQNIDIEFVSNVYQVNHRPVIQCNIRNITERKQAEIKLRESEEKYRNLFNNSEVGYFRTRLDGSEILEFNEKFLSLLNYTGEEVKGMPSVNIWADRNERDEIVKMLEAEGQVTDFECGILNKQGEVLHCLTSLHLYRNTGILEGSIINISDRKRAEETLKSINDRFELATNAAEISVWEHDFITDIIKIDDNFNLIYGNTQGNYQIGFNEFIKFIHPDDVDIIKINIDERIKTNKNTSYEFRIIRPDGVIRNIKAYGKIVKDKTNKPLKFIGINLDISESKKAAQELIKAKEQAEESDRLKSSFLANMSHEIRTPMNGILGFASLLKEAKLSGKMQKDYIGMIEQSGERMLNIINDIISISKVEAGQMDVNLSETNVNEQIRYIIKFFIPEANKKGLQLLTKSVLTGKKAILNTDKDKLNAILSNLVKNALKFTEAGSIEIGCKMKGKHLEFFVKDTGIGFGVEHKEIIFERFRQVGETLSRNYEGAGLGLSIARAYVEMLGGEIRAESEPGKGSAFYFTLPYNAEPEAKTATGMAIQGVVKESKVKNLKILLAEDDKISERLLTFAVKIFSREILMVNNGMEAVETCRNQADVDLVLMDIQMPQMDGYEATKQIRKFNKNVIIIAQTAYALAGDRIKAIEAGCDDYIPKPIDKDLLTTLINKYFNKKAKN